MNKPLVTIITSAYNCEKYIEEVIRSVIDNGYDNIQYIIYDDGSTDRTLDIAAKFDVYGKSAKVSVYHHENQGEHATVNTCFKMIKGKYFMLVNADDPLLPGAISTLVYFMEKNQDIACGYPDWNSIGDNSDFRSHVKSREYDYRFMIKHHTCLPSVGSIIRTDVLEVLKCRDTTFRWLSDFDFWLRLGLSFKMKRVPQTLATWRSHATQASAMHSDLRSQEHIRLMQKYYSLNNMPDSILAVKKEAICWSYIVAASVTNSKLRFIEYLIKAFASYPIILLSFEFWHSLIRRANYIIRR